MARDAIKDFRVNLISILSSSISEFDDDKISEAANMIYDALKTSNRVHITGIGKPGDLAHYLAASFSSVGIPAYHLDGTEVVHGSCGQLAPGDVVIFISNSGNTAEMKIGFNAVKDMQVKTIGVTGNPNSFLAKESDLALIAAVKKEGGPLNLAPRASILAEAAILQAVSVGVQTLCNFKPEDFHLRHKSGALGEMLAKTKLF